MELEEPRGAVQSAGAETELLSIESGEIQAMNGDTDLVRGRRITSYPSIRTNLRNAGAEVLDEEVVVDQGLVSSRNPDDLHAFCAKIVEEFAEGAHDVAPEGATAES